MYSIVESIIGSPSVSSDLICSVCGFLIVIFSCVIIDLIYRVFSHFWRG